MGRIRSHLTYANVVATACLFLLIGGGTAAASIIVSSNTQVAAGTISGHHPPTGDHANIIGGSVNGTDLATGAVAQSKLATNSVNSTKVVDGSLTGSDVANDTLSGQQINESSLAGSQITGVDAATLGGRGASSFMQGSGTAASGGTDIFSGKSNQAVMSVPGMGDITADCNGAANAGAINYVNTAAKQDFTRDNNGTLSSGQVAPSSTVSASTGSSATQTYHLYSQSGGEVSTVSIAFLTSGDDSNVPPGQCRIYAQAVKTP